jgi:2-dehydro-3-deoxygluconokinase
MALFTAEREGALDEVDHFARSVAGAELNFAVGMARLGQGVAYIAKLGHDPFGRYIYKFLQNNRINTRYIRFDSTGLTGFQLKEKVSAGDPEVVSYRKNSAASQLNLQDIGGIEWENVSHLHVTGIPPALSATCRAVSYKLIEDAKARKIPVSFDPNLRPQLWSDREEMIQVVNDLAGSSDIVLPGIQEGLVLTGSKDANEIADFYLNRGVASVVVKLGPEGAFVKTRTTSVVVPGFGVDKVVDTVGAGDGFAVGVISGLLAGLPLQDAVRRGNAIGALAVMSPGDNDGLPDGEQLASFMRQKDA